MKRQPVPFRVVPYIFMIAASGDIDDAAWSSPICFDLEINYE